MTEAERAEVARIETAYRVMAQAYAAQSAALIHWVQQGNKLPDCYR